MVERGRRLELMISTLEGCALPLSYPHKSVMVRRRWANGLIFAKAHKLPRKRFKSIFRYETTTPGEGERYASITYDEARATRGRTRGPLTNVSGREVATVHYMQDANCLLAGPLQHTIAKAQRRAGES